MAGADLVRVALRVKIVVLVCFVLSELQGEGEGREKGPSGNKTMSQITAGSCDTLLWHSVQVSQGRSGAQDIVQRTLCRMAIFLIQGRQFVLITKIKQHLTGPNKNIPRPTATEGNNNLR